MLSAAAAVPKPGHIVLTAPWTPFQAEPGPSPAVNISAIPALATCVQSLGANTVWIGGGMGQFDAMSAAERMELTEAWLKAPASAGMYRIAHVGSNVLSEARAMAAHAASNGADAIAAVPQCYEGGDAATQVQWLRAISDAAPSLPIFYYHIPGSTHVDIKMLDLVKAAATGLKTLGGIKYVSGDEMDWFQTTQFLNSSAAAGMDVSMLWAPEPKLTSFSLGGVGGTILAEPYYATWYNQMRAAEVSGKEDDARAIQQWKLDVSSALSSHGAGASRAVLRDLCGVEMGPQRLPQKDFDESQRAAMVSDLKKLHFFTKVMPTH
eukprot:TRINITY_DN2037_c0_g1_i1.p2 TRINITY_DN2037_c0_g1~~TRINITY_DN2037_c0_g1_i1.p2  ORF type:complete len:349 (+),score=130.78 TRINITY_DN2037_c0_g1_i1:83-1048(+)